MITLYDIPCKYEGVTWSPNTLKTKFVLNYKGIQHKTIWIEYPDIGPTMQAEGFPPTGKRPDGSDLYTVPAIVDDSTGAKVSDSIKIAEYLDKQYPDTPAIFPSNSSALQHAFYAQFYPAIQPVWSTILPKVPGVLTTERSKEWYITARSKLFGKPLADLEPVGEVRAQVLGKVREAFNTFDGFYQKSSGPFVMGDAPSFVDFVIVSVISGFTLWGKESDDWKDFKTWNGGRWINLYEKLEKYARSDE